MSLWQADRVEITYDPKPDGRPDPGEVVWTWVPYEDDPSQGKDRPVLVIGEEGGLLLALQLTSQDHDRDEEQERRAGREWMDIGSGAWDSQGRASEVRLNRLLRLEPGAVRREGAALPKPVFDKVKKALNDTLQSPDFKKKMEASGSTVAATTVNIDQFLAAEVAKYKKIVEFAKIEE